MNRVLAIDVARDLIGLRAVLPDFLEEAAESSSPRVTLQPASPRVPFAYRKWIEHLFLLDSLPSLELDADEARGLAELRRQREQFSETHFRCPGCKLWLRSHSNWCHCGWKKPPSSTEHANG